MYNRPISYSRLEHDKDHNLQTTQHTETYADFRNHLLAHHDKSIPDAERWTTLCSPLSNSHSSDSDIDFVSIQFNATYNPTRIFDKLKDYKYIVYSVANDEHDEHVAIVFLDEPISQEQKPDFENWFRSRGRLERDQVVFDAVELPDGEFLKELSGQPLGNLIPVQEFIEHQAYIDKRLCEEFDARLSQADLDVAISKPSKRPSLRNKKQFKKELVVQRIDFDQNNEPIASEHTTCWSDITEILWNHAEKRIAADQRWTMFSPVEDIWCFLTFVFPSVHQPSDIIKMFNGHEFCIYSIKDSNNKSLKTYDHAVVLPLDGAVSQELKQTFMDTLVKQKGIPNDVQLSVLEMPSDHGSFFEHHQGKPISVLDIMLEYRDSQVTDVKNIVHELNEQFNHHLFYLDAPVSARKTFSAVLYALEQARSSRKTVIAQPSVACVKEWYLKANMLAGDIPIKRFHQECCAENNVRGELMEYLKHPAKVGEVILVTQQCLLGVRYFHHASDWDLIVDEIPSVDDKIEIKLPKHFPMITDLIEVKSTGAETSVVQPKDQASESTLKGYAENTGDDAVANVFQEIARSLLSKDHVVEVQNQNYHRTLKGDTKDKNGKTIPLVFFIRMKPTIFDQFRTTTIMGAVFNYSLLSQLWANELVEFTEHQGITRGLSFNEAQNGNRLVIKVLSDEGYSKTLARKEQIIDGEVVTNKEVMLYAIKHEFGDEPFAYLVNKDTEKLAKSIFEGTKGKRLPYNPHGLNGFSGYHNVAIMASFRAQPLRQNYLNNNRIDSNMVLDGEQHSLIYQAIGRTSLRNQNRNEIVTAIVTDKAVGRFIQEQWPGSKLIDMDGVSLAARGKSGPKRKHQNNAKKQEATRERARLKLKNQFKQDSHIRFFEKAAKAINDHSLGDSLNDSGVPEKYHQNLLRITNKTLIGNSIRKNVVLFDNYNFDREIIGFPELEQHDFVGTLLDAKNDPDVSNLMMADSFDEFVDQLREDHKKVLQSKSDNLLVSPALYDPELDQDHVRSLDNIVFANNIWIDVDEGEMTNTAFRQMFPEFKMVLFNTYQSTDNTRFRAVIQTDSYMTKEQYRSITKQIEKVVKDEGYVGKQAKRKGSEKPCHGIDTSKLQAMSLFYLPSQAEAGPAASFFEYQDGKPIPVMEWCLNSIEQPEQEPNYREYTYDNPTDRRADENEARDILQTKLDKIGTSCESERNETLFGCAMPVFSLVKKGLLPDHEARQLLHAAAVSTGLDSRSVYSTIKSARNRSSSEYPVLKSEHQQNNSGV